jgi:Holliday junction DNA helicase RuvA
MESMGTDVRLRLSVANRGAIAALRSQGELDALFIRCGTSLSFVALRQAFALMIALLTGRIDQLTESSCVLDVNGVGYLVHASTRTLGALPQPPAGARLLIETQVREDAITLYGFADPAEREWFRLLNTVQGVGAKVALSILSALSPRDLVGAIAAGDRASLTRAQGVGPRLAVRLLTELKEKAGGMPAAAPGLSVPAIRPAGAAQDALSALTNLGYRRAEAEPVIGRVLERLGEAASVDALIRESLKELAQRAG